VHAVICATSAAERPNQTLAIVMSAFLLLYTLWATYVANLAIRASTKRISKSPSS
jgi:hypothetical protein